MKTPKIIPILLLLSFISCKKKTEVVVEDPNLKFVPTDVSVTTSSNFTIDKVFEFINSLDLNVEYIKYGTYTSALPSDSLQYVLDYLNAKPYTNVNHTWFVTGYLNYNTQIITIFPRLFQIMNKEYQADWLQSMKFLQLLEKPGYNIYFHVPEGKEKEWVAKFKKYDFVVSANLNLIVEYQTY